MTILPAYVYSNWKNITLVLIIAYCLFQVSLAKVPLLVYTILYGVTEENNVGGKFLKNVFHYICGFICIKYFLKSVFIVQIIGPHEFIPQIGKKLTEHQLSYIQFLFGNVSFDFLEVLALFAIIARSI